MEATAIRRSLSPWRPGASLLAFAATLALVTAFTRISFLAPFGASEGVLDEMRRLIPWMVAVVALVHASLAALAARARSASLGVGLLVAICAALSLLPQVAYPVLLPLVREAAPTFCNMAPEYCPPAGWSPAVGALIGLALSPIVATAIRLRASDALDAPASMMTVTGAWTGLLATGLLLTEHVPGDSLPLAYGVSLACLFTALLDALVRGRRLRVLVAQGRAIVTERREDDPADLGAYTALGATALGDHVLRVDEQRVAGPYRGMRHGHPIARVPADLRAVHDALRTALRIRALLFTTLGGVVVAWAVAR
jgi:hypothetical protein